MLPAVCAVKVWMSIFIDVNLLTRSPPAAAAAPAALKDARLRRALRQLALHRVTHRDPAALDARNRALDQDQAALDVGLDHDDVLRGDALDTQWPGIFLFLNTLPGSWRLPVEPIERCDDRHAVGGAQAAEVPALHAAGEALADRGAGHVHELAGHEMVGGDFRAHRDQRSRGSRGTPGACASARPSARRNGRAPPWSGA